MKIIYLWKQDYEMKYRKRILTKFKWFQFVAFCRLPAFSLTQYSRIACFDEVTTFLLYFFRTFYLDWIVWILQTRNGTTKRKTCSFQSFHESLGMAVSICGIKGRVLFFNEKSKRKSHCATVIKTKVSLHQNEILRPIENEELKIEIKVFSVLRWNTSIEFEK